MLCYFHCDYCVFALRQTGVFRFGDSADTQHTEAAPTVAGRDFMTVAGAALVKSEIQTGENDFQCLNKHNQGSWSAVPTNVLPHKIGISLSFFPTFRCVVNASSTCSTLRPRPPLVGWAAVCQW